MIPAARRATEAATLIGQGRWFSLVSGRQTGKTTVVQHLAATLNAEGDSPRSGSTWRLSAASTIPPRPSRRRCSTPSTAPSQRTSPSCRAIDARGRVAGSETHRGGAAVPLRGVRRERPAAGAAPRRGRRAWWARRWCRSSRSSARCIWRAGGKPAPWSVVLIGVRSIRDYVVSDGQRTVPWLGSASPFNITVENVTLAAFTEAEVAELVAQHTAETGQRFEPEAVALLHHLSAGHPWLVNALADQATRRDVPDRAVAITAAHIEAAKETILLERAYAHRLALRAAARGARAPRARPHARGRPRVGRPARRRRRLRRGPRAAREARAGHGWWPTRSTAR